MKPAPFKYYAPTTVKEALTHLAEHGYDAKPLAGGQSLVPTMNFRLSQPAALVDLNNVSELFYIRSDNGNGGLRMGAMTRQVQVEHHALVAERSPLFHGAMPSIGFCQTRNRGTIGGSLAHTGKTFKALSKGEELIDPETGLSLGGEDEVLGSLRVVTVKDKFSIAEPVDFDVARLQRGDKVVATDKAAPLEFAQSWQGPGGKKK